MFGENWKVKTSNAEGHYYIIRKLSVHQHYVWRYPYIYLPIVHSDTLTNNKYTARFKMEMNQEYLKYKEEHKSIN